MFWRETFVYKYKHCYTCNFHVDCGHSPEVSPWCWLPKYSWNGCFDLFMLDISVYMYLYSFWKTLVSWYPVDTLIVSQTKVFLNFITGLFLPRLVPHLQAGILPRQEFWNPAFTVSLPYLRTAGLPVTYYLTPLPAIQAACQWAHLTELSL